MSRRVFGEELSDIFSISKLSAKNIDSYPSVHREFRMVFPHEINPGKYQPRRNFDQNSLQDLANSIKEKGILQPLIVRKSGSEYELIAGERRWRAAQIAGLKQIPVVICEIDDNHALAYSLIENIQRQDLDPIEEATSLKRLLEEFSMTHEEVAKSVGRSRTMVTNMLRLLNLAEPVKNMLVSRQLEMGHARALLCLPEGKQIKTAKLIVDKRMTVRGTEVYVKALQIDPQAEKIVVDKNSKFLEWEKELFEMLGVDTKIQISAQGKGRVICYFSNVDNLEGLINKLRKKL